MKTILSAIIFVGFSTMVLAQSKQEKEAGVIQIKDNKAIIAGNGRKEKDDFKWEPVLENEFVKTDILNKNKSKCKK